MSENYSDMKCAFCKPIKELPAGFRKEYLNPPTCSYGYVMIGSYTYRHDIYPRPDRRLPNKELVGKRCRDCGVTYGGIHHVGCHEEQCPKCRKELGWCECTRHGVDFYKTSNATGRYIHGRRRYYDHQYVFCKPLKVKDW